MMDAYKARDGLGTPVAEVAPAPGGVSDDEVLQHFVVDQLPPHLQVVSLVFRGAMEEMLRKIPATARGDQFRHGVQRLLEAKDAFVRAARG